MRSADTGGKTELNHAFAPVVVTLIVAILTTHLALQTWVGYALAVTKGLTIKNLSKSS
jgi:predicted DNA-binding transcriptional regulator